MKLLIAYAGKTGGSADMCALLASLLKNHAVTVCDLAKTDPVIGDYDYVVFGGAVHFAKLYRPARRFLKQHEKELAALPHTLFLTCAFAEQFQNYADMIFPADLIETAEQVVYFGGELDPKKARGLDRLLIRAVRSHIRDSEDGDATLPGLLPEHVRMLADTLRAK